MSDALRQVEAQVREIVRRRGLDPQAAPRAVLDIVESVVADFGERSADGSAAMPMNGVEVTRTVLDAVAGFGPIQPFLDDPSVEEIWINEPGRVFVARDGCSELTPTVLSAGAVQEVVERMLAGSGRRVDVSSPFVDAALPDGSRLHVVIPDVTRRHWAVNIRKFNAPVARLADLVRLGAITSQVAGFLGAAVVSGLNIVVAGATQAGKTTLLNTLVNALPADRRLVTCEEVFELRPLVPDSVAMQTRQPSLDGCGEIPLRRLVKEAMRMRPGCLVIGEVRQQECLDLLIALNSGVPGMCTVHASSAREAVVKLCTLPMLAGSNVTTSFVVPTVAASVDVVVFCAVNPDGRRCVRDVVALSGRVEGDVVELSSLFTERDGCLVRGAGYAPHPDKFRRAGFDPAAVLAGPPDGQG